jgi:hypothetical protein
MISKDYIKYGSKLQGCPITVIPRPLVRFSEAVNRMTCFVSQYSVDSDIKLNFRYSFWAVLQAACGSVCLPCFVGYERGPIEHGLISIDNTFTDTILRISVFVLCAWGEAK